jgi:hypothetical protein
MIVPYRRAYKSANAVREAALPATLTETGYSVSGPVAVAGEYLNIGQLSVSRSEAWNDGYVGGSCSAAVIQYIITHAELESRDGREDGEIGGMGSFGYRDGALSERGRRAGRERTSRR